ncbi:MAG: VWA domain-containing protein [Actinomycetia bacterium]|nr:VWA domain-containing protein [Actinomycetes bacterium]
MREPDHLGFVALLRERGLRVPVTASLAWTEALGILGTDPTDVYWAGRATLVRSPEEQAPYDAAFAEFFLGAVPAGREGEPGQSTRSEPAPAGPQDPGLSADEAPEAVALSWSRVEQLSGRDFAECSDEELGELYDAISRIRLCTPARRSRRRRPAHRGESDMRGSMRRALRTGGEMLDPARRDRAGTPRKVVLVVDVSGSMEPYARALLRFAHAAVQSSARVEVFAFATRLTRLTRELASREPDEALHLGSEAVADMSGGTRLGEVLSAFNDRWGMRGAARGAVVVVLSDGWDRGEPGRVSEEMQRLQRVAHRVVWVNPLRASPGYQPLAAGMAEALPFVDDFVDGHSLASLSALADLLSDPAPGARFGSR